MSATAFSLWQMREAQRQRDAAVAAGKRADAQAEFASMLMSQVGDKPVTVREILDRARGGIEHQYSGDPAFITSALLQLSSEYSELGDCEIRAADPRARRVDRRCLSRLRAPRRGPLQSSPTTCGPRASTRRPIACLQSADCDVAPFP